jgi:hypothetical protein
MGAHALKLTPLAAALTCVAMLLPLPAAANGKAALNFSVGPAMDNPDGAKISVTGTEGRYDRIGTAPLSLSLRLSADTAAGSAGHKIVGSDVFLKQTGSGDGAGSVKAFDGSAPVSRIDLSGDFDFALVAKSEIAQNAIALCNGRPSGDRLGTASHTLSVPVVWRVTTGRFTFKWTNYDRVAPTQEIQNNPDFYGERETLEAEASAEVAVVCEPLGRAIAQKREVAKPVTVEPKIETAPVQRLVAESIVTKTAEPHAAGAVVTPPVKTVSLGPAVKPACDGGMVRETGSSLEAYLCLCPGNTERIMTGTNAFRCERKGRR